MKLTTIFVLSLCLFSSSFAKKSLPDQEEAKFPAFDASSLDYQVLTNSNEVNLAAIFNEYTQSFEVRNNTEASLPVTSSNVCAVISYSRTLKEIGWDVMYLDTNPAFSAENQMACAGFLEGIASQEGIGYFYYNQLSEHERTPAEYKAFFDRVYENMFNRIAQATTDEEVLYWQTAKLLYIQLIGMKQGHNSLIPKSVKNIEIWQLSLTNISGQEEELDAIIKASKKKSKVVKSASSFLNFFVPTTTPTSDNDDDDDDEMMRKARCSVFFKLLSSTNEKNEIVLEDVIASHSTWEGYSYMNRVYKYYNLPSLRSNKRYSIQMSSYPGTITSTDDYFVKEGLFLVTETSIAPLKMKSFFKSFSAQDVDIPDFMRTMTSLHLSKSGKEWTDFMQGFGEVKMYSSEWMVLDFKHLEFGSAIPKNTFLIFTSSFQLQKVEDFTQRLISNTFYGSFNYPELKEAQKYLGYTEAVKLGTYYPYDKDPRYEIFEFFGPKANNITEVQWLMQYNGYKQTVIPGEPVFKSPKDAIGSRWDLTKKNPVAYGEVDAKVADLHLLKRFEVQAISGPSHQEQPVFSWAEWKDDDLHDGQPLVWNFDWVRLSPQEHSSNNYSSSV